MGGEELKWHQPSHHKLWSLHFSPHSTESMIKAHSSGRMVSSGISDVVIASVHSEKTRLKKLMMTMTMRMMMMMMIINKLQETMVFRGGQNL